MSDHGEQPLDYATPAKSTPQPGTARRAAYQGVSLLLAVPGIMSTLDGCIGLMIAFGTPVDHPHARHDAFVQVWLFLAIGVVCLVAAFRSGREGSPPSGGT